MEFDSSYQEAYKADKEYALLSIAAVNISIKIDEQTYYMIHLKNINEIRESDRNKNNSNLTVVFNKIRPLDLDRLYMKSSEYKVDIIEIWQDENKNIFYFTQPVRTYTDMNISYNYDSELQTSRWELYFTGGKSCTMN